MTLNDLKKYIDNEVSLHPERLDNEVMIWQHIDDLERAVGGNVEKKYIPTQIIKSLTIGGNAKEEFVLVQVQSANKLYWYEKIT